MSNTKHDIAIVSLSGRFPGARSIDEYWDNLCAGKESITFFTDEQLIQAGIPANVVKNPKYVKASPLLENIDLFDAKFFHFLPHEAETIDPQQRLLLECAWELLEKAGYPPDTYSGKIGMFCGSGGVVSSYFSEYLLKNPEIQGTTASFEHLGNDKDFIATRVAYKLNLRGPSITVQTACSTSLVTVHLACKSILNGECDMAIAGGVSIRVPQVTGYFRQKGDIYSEDGHCRPFDANASGVVFGSGIGLVLLKPLRKAILDHDLIYAVIKGSAVNNDGGHKVSYMASSAIGQSDCIEAALKQTGTNPATISFVETHGTGTLMGDPVEISALTKVFREYTKKNKFCALGSVKANVGHLDIASGIASFIKTVLCIHHKKIPPCVNFNHPNPKINFEKTPFYVNTKLLNWATAKRKRRAGINSLGIGGTNAFCVLEEPPTISIGKKESYKSSY